MPTPTVADHYTRPDLAGAIFNGLHKLGQDPLALTPADLAPVDQFHIGARDATLALIALARLEPNMKVLDAGGGLGGPARTLAVEAAAHVTVLDLTQEFIRVGALLTERTGLAGQVTFQHGDATRLPFPDASFDVVWTQHSTMNIADKEALYREAQRVLRPNGKLAFHEIMAGPRQPIHLPVPWASQPALSCLRPPAGVRGLLQRTGFHELAWNDVTLAARDWWRDRVTAAASQPAPPLGLHLLLGPNAPTIVGNLLRNLEEDRVVVIQAVFSRP